MDCVLCVLWTEACVQVDGACETGMPGVSVRWNMTSVHSGHFFHTGQRWNDTFCQCLERGDGKLRKPLSLYLTAHRLLDVAAIPIANMEVRERKDKGDKETQPSDLP